MASAMRQTFEPGYTRRAGTKRRMDTFESKGRTNITQDQALTNFSVMMDTEIFKKRRNKADPEYPLHKADDLKAEKGEVAMFDDSAPINTNPLSINRPVSTRADGLNSNHDEVSFAGIVEKGANPASAADPSISLCRSGMKTIVNTGIDYIPPGAHVIADFPPYNESNGRKTPAVPVPGAKTNFLWAVRPINHAEVFQQFAYCAREVMSRCWNKLEEDAKSHFGVRFPDGTDQSVFDECVKRCKGVADEYCLIKWAKAGADSPLNRYVQWVLFMLGAVNHTNWMVPQSKDTRDVVQNAVLGNIITKRQRSAPPRNREVTVDFNPPTGLQRAMFIASFPTCMMADQLRYYRRNFVGTAMTGAKPGDSFTIFVGHGFS